MTQPRPVSYAALVLAALALVVSAVAVAGGTAEAAGKKIGKNLVVSKSIKNGAVTGAKVKDGSLTAADLAPGTILPPAPAGKVAAFAGCATCVANAPSAASSFQLSGYVAGGGGPELPVPVALTLADFRVFGAFQTAGHELSVQLQYKSPGEPTYTTVPLCTVPEGDSNCDVAGPVTVPAGDVARFATGAGPGGASGTSVSIGYTMRVVS